MDSRTDGVQFQLPVTWDIALRVLKHTARHGHTPLEIHLQGNGYLQLRQSRPLHNTTVIDVSLLAAGTSTTVLANNVTRGLWISGRERRRVAALLDQFRSDAERFASHPHSVDDLSGPKPARSSSQGIGEFTRLRIASID